MTRPDVPGDDMTPHEFSDDDAEAIISGFAPGEPELGAALDDLRSAFAAVEPPTASGALSEFIVRGADPAPVSAGAAAVPSIEPLVDTTTRRHPVLASLSAFAGTALGKLCIGASVATAAVGGATVAGVDTPVADLFDDDAIVVTEPDDTDDIDPLDVDEPDVDDAATEDDSEPDDEVESLDDTDSDDSDDDNDDDSQDSDDADGSDDADESDDGDDSHSDDSDDADDSDDSDDAEDADESDDGGDSDSDGSDSDDSDDADDADESPTTTAPTTTSAPGSGSASVTHTVPGVGSVSFTYTNGAWTLDAVTPTGGFVADEASIDDDGPDVTFAEGSIEVDVDVEIEDGQIRVRVRVENDDTDERTETFFWYPLS